MSATDIVLILGAVGALVTALVAAYVNLRGEVKKVHSIVNQQRTDMLKYQADLVRTLREAGLTVPKDKSL